MPQYVRFPLPDPGEGLTEADIVAWKVAAGDAVAVNQAIIEIETAKSLVELPSPYAGVVSELLVEVGQTVPVGEAIMVIDTDPGGEPVSTADDGGAAAGDTADAPGTPVGAGDDGGAGVGDAGAEAGARPGGAATTAPEPAGIAPATAVPATPAPAATAPVAAAPVPTAAAEEPAETSGDVLVGYGTKGARTRRRRRAPEPGMPAAPATGPQPAATRPAAPSSAPAAPPNPVLAKPPVRKLAKDLGVDLARIPGTGPGGIITREDVVAAHAQEEPRELATYPEEPWLDGGTVSEDGRQTRVPVRSVRRRTAEAMVASAFTAPHVTVFTTVDVSKTMKLVERLKSDPEFTDVRITPLLIAAKALILAIKRNPAISAAWDEAAQEIVYKHYINLGIAAATPRGLVVPNIADAHRMSLHELAGAIGDLTRTARAGKTTPAAMREGTVTITNVGVFGIDTGTPILNPGESAILAFGAISQRPWVHKGKLKPRWVTQLALSFDHRLVDGELGSRVLADVARVMEDPTQGLVWG